MVNRFHLSLFERPFIYLLCMCWRVVVLILGSPITPQHPGTFSIWVAGLDWGNARAWLRITEQSTGTGRFNEPCSSDTGSDVVGPLAKDFFCQLTNWERCQAPRGHVLKSTIIIDYITSFLT